MLDKKKVLQTIKELPDSFSIEEVIDRIILSQKVEIGLEQSKKGETLTTSEAKTRLKPIVQPRKNWEDEFAEMHSNCDDKLLIDSVFEDENWD